MLGSYLGNSRIFVPDVENKNLEFLKWQCTWKEKDHQSNKSRAYWQTSQLRKCIGKVKKIDENAGLYDDEEGG
jgi:hypothetical protein